MMFVTEYNIIRAGKNIGLLKITKDGFSLPDLPGFSELVDSMLIGGHMLVMYESRGKIVVQVKPWDMTKGEMLRPLRHRMISLGFDLCPSSG